MDSVNLETTQKDPKDILFDFADMLANVCGTTDEPNHEKALSVMMKMTALGYEKPSFVRKMFSEKMMTKIAELVPKFKDKNFGMLDVIAVMPDLKRTFDDA